MATTVTATTETKKGFLSADVGQNGDKLYAFHLEGYEAAPPFFKEATQDKKAFLAVNMGIRGSAEALFDRASGVWSKEKTYPEQDGYVRLKFFGEAAEEASKTLSVGRHLVVAGRMKKEEFTDRDGNPAEGVTIDVDGMADLGSRKNNIPATVGDKVVGTTRTYTTRDGVIHHAATACLVQGTILNLKPLAVSAKGTAYLRFGVRTRLPAEKVSDLANGIDPTGKEYDKDKKIVDVVVFNDMATRLAKILANNAQVVMTGEINSHEYEGKVSYQMIPRDLTIMKFPPREDTPTNNSATSTATAGPATSGMAAENTQAAAESAAGCFIEDDEDGEDLPF